MHWPKGEVLTHSQPWRDRFLNYSSRKRCPSPSSLGMGMLTWWDCLFATTMKQARSWVTYWIPLGNAVEGGGMSNSQKCHSSHNILKISVLEFTCVLSKLSVKCVAFNESKGWVCACGCKPIATGKSSIWLRETRPETARGIQPKKWA